MACFHYAGGATDASGNSGRADQGKISLTVSGRNRKSRGKLCWASLRDTGAFGPSRQRYRIIYKVEQAKVIIIVVAVGLRKEGAKKDIYALARKLLRLRLTE